jgi:mRNA-degrading endonuclease RelE of RelBE toxin-antitoxin system
MTFEEQVLQKLRDLPPQRQKEVLAFVTRLQERSERRYRSLRGLWADLDLRVSENDISSARREMWGNFPRDVS